MKHVVKCSFEKKCLFCGNSFLTGHNASRYCSPRCKNAANTAQRPVHEHHCKNCGSVFNTINKTQHFCSRSCSSRWHGGLAKKYYTCKHCGCSFNNENGYRVQYCCKKCAYDAKYGTPEARELIRAEKQRIMQEEMSTVCPICRRQFTRSTTNQLYCSSDCTYQAQLIRKRQQWMDTYQPRHFVCSECGSNIVTQYKDMHSCFCCESCAKKYFRRIEHQTARHKAFINEMKKKREVQIKRSFVEPVSYETVFNQAQGICEVCGLPVIYDKLADNNWSGTIDHIVPLSCGGAHSLSNCQLAHRICNSLKGNRGEDFRIDWEQKAQEDRYWHRKYSDGLDILQKMA